MSEIKSKAEAHEWILTHVRQRPGCQDFSQEFRLLGKGPKWECIPTNCYDWAALPWRRSTTSWARLDGDSSSKASRPWLPCTQGSSRKTPCGHGKRLPGTSASMTSAGAPTKPARWRSCDLGAVHPSADEELRRRAKRATYRRSDPRKTRVPLAFGGVPAREAPRTRSGTR